MLEKLVFNLKRKRGPEAYNAYLDRLNPETRMAVSNFYDAGFNTTDVSYNPYSTINSNRYNHLGRKENPGDKLYADLIKAQTRDYLTRFAPVEQFMANEITATGTRSLQGDLGRTRDAVLGANRNVEGQQARAMGRMGLNYTPASQNNQAAVGALVGGLNDTRMRDADRRQAMMSGNLGAISQKARGSIK